MRTLLHFTFALAAAVAMCGCGSSAGPGQFDVSGTASFDGKPIPAGSISFEPDASKGNRGSGAVAQIKDGRFSTPRGQGHMGGPHVVRIVAFDGVPTTIDGKPGGMELPQGKPLFPPYETRVDLPKASSQQDFKVPPAAPKAMRR